MKKPRENETVPETKGCLIRWASFYDRLTSVLFLGKEGAVREATVDLTNIQKGAESVTTVPIRARIRREQGDVRG
jgi:ubiquinone/menaquinone biosynthesis C-methylase UbiE